MSTSEPDRRSVLTGGAAGLLGLAGCTPEGDSDTALPAGQIDHVVVVMMENRSFDHYLGSLTVEEGREDVDGLTGAESNPDADGVDVPVYHLMTDCLEADPPHSWSTSHDQFNDGANDGFVQTYAQRSGFSGHEVMGYHVREQLPVHYGLADHYCVPDRFFASVLGPTWPNRFHAQCGTSYGMDNNAREDAPFDVDSIFLQVDAAGHDWRIYYTDVPFTAIYQDHWVDERMAMSEDFARDCERGDLPALTWIDPGFSINDDHPPHHPILGQAFLGMVYEALAQSPLWERCLLVITYDEHGGFHDHVAPPTTEDDYASEGFDQLGFRVPVLVVGPWVKQGVVSTTFDHTSVLAFLADHLGFDRWTTRMQAANSIAECLDTERMASGVPLEPVTLEPFEVPELEELDTTCFYDVAFRDREQALSGQPELEDYVRSGDFPGTHRLDQRDEVRRRLLAEARRLGVIR